MSSEQAATGWILHSLAQGRRFGPLSEDDLRSYFRAGMVQSVDRLTAPGEFTMRPAAEVAAMLGENVPPGPPPPPLAEPPAPAPRPPQVAAGMPVPPVAARTPGTDAAAEERAAKAMAAMNMDFAALAASEKSAKRSGWTLPLVAVVALVALLLFALGVAHKLEPSNATVVAQDTGAPPPNVNAAVAAASAEPEAQAAEPAESVETDENGTPTASSSEDPEYQAFFQKAAALAGAEDWKGLSAHAHAWSKAQPDRNEPLQFLAVGYARAGNNAPAIEALEKILARDPGNANARSLIADVYVQAQRFPEALTAYKALVAEQPQNARIWNNYGSALMQSGQPAQAVAALETAVKIDPSFKEAWTNLGKTYQSMGDDARASAAFANAH